MKRAILLITTMAAALVVASGVALAAVIDCATVGNPCVGTNNNDTMTGTAGFDDMRGRGGADRMSARAGNDRLSGGPGGDLLSGQGSSDRYLFAGAWGQDRIPADGEGAGTDTLNFSAQTSSLLIDLVPSVLDEANAGASNTLNFPSTVVIENVLGGSGGDTIFGNNANNRLFGNGALDILEGLGGNDTLVGGTGSDQLFGQMGNDTLNGGEDSDLYIFSDGWGNDTIVADASGDKDRLTFVNLTSGVNVDLAVTDPVAGAVSGTNTVKFPSGLIDTVHGSSTAGDTIYGDDLANSLLGLSGANELGGRGGNDTIYGGFDNDIIYGGTGTDTVYGDTPSSSGGGDDYIDVADGDRGDIVVCGDGTDTVEVDAELTTNGDQVLDTHSASCESENVTKVFPSEPEPK